MRSYQNSIARTFSADVLDHILGESWMKAALKYNAVMSGKSCTFDLYLQQQPRTMLMYERAGHKDMGIEIAVLHMYS